MSWWDEYERKQWLSLALSTPSDNESLAGVFAKFHHVSIWAPGVLCASSQKTYYMLKYFSTPHFQVCHVLCILISVNQCYLTLSFYISTVWHQARRDWRKTWWQKTFERRYYDTNTLPHQYHILVKIQIFHVEPADVEGCSQLRQSTDQW